MRNQNASNRAKQNQRNSSATGNRSQPRGWAAGQRSSEQCSHPLGTAVCALGSLALGAGLMYLFDPTAGTSRRRQVRTMAADAIDSAGDTLGSAWDTVTHQAHHFADAGASTASNLADRIRERASDAAESARSLLPSTASLSRRARYYLPKEEGFSGSALGMSAAGALALGLGAMWLLDPQRGRARRAWVGQKAGRFMNETSDFMCATGRHLRNKFYGYAHATRKVAQRGADFFTDSAIAERVRSMLGSLALVPVGSVGVSCEGGCVTLSGRCDQSDVGGILEATRNVEGVDSISNQLDVRQSTPSL